MDPNPSGIQTLKRKARTEMEVTAGGGRRFLKSSGTESLPSVWANPGVLRSKSWVEYVPPGEKGEDKSLQLWRRKRGETVMSDQV